MTHWKFTHIIFCKRFKEFLRIVYIKICFWFLFFKHLESIRISGISKRVEHGAKYIVRVPYAKSAVLPCDAYGELPLFIKWWLVRPEVLIGSYNFENRTVVMNWTRNGSYEIIPGGLLFIKIASRDLVERYRCVLSNSKVGFSLTTKTALRLKFLFVLY